MASATYKRYTLTASNGSPTSSVQPLARTYFLGPFYTQLAVKITSGTPNFTVQYTYDEVDAITMWFDATDITGATADADARMDSPVTAVRIVVNSGTGAVTLTATQVFIDQS